MTSPTDLQPPELRRIRMQLARKGMEVNGQLTTLLAGQNARLLDLKMPHEQTPGLKPQEKLRRYLDQIIRAQRRLGTDAWGKCVTCGTALPPQALSDTPWLEECEPCKNDTGLW